jgi:2-methylaconitate cis-trans-isomerase PrpF
MNKIIIALGIAAVAIGSAASAEDPVNLRQINQDRRIDAGHRSGKLTRWETEQLKAQQASIAREEDRMRARHGGHLTARDKAIIHARQDRANRAILKQKYDAQRGPNHLKL